MWAVNSHCKTKVGHPHTASGQSEAGKSAGTAFIAIFHRGLSTVPKDALIHAILSKTHTEHIISKLQ